MLPDPIAVTTKVTTVLENLNVPYFICGSLASTFHGMIRTTQDSDLAAILGKHHVMPFIEALDGEFFIDAEMVKEAIRRRGSFNIIHRESMFKVDIFIPTMRGFEESQFERAAEQILSEKPQVQARIATAEDTLLAKLEWYLLGNEVSERQWRDVIGILKVQGSNLDFDYLRQFAQELQVDDLLEKALSEAEE
jgi:hypothetical protein